MCPVPQQCSLACCMCCANVGALLYSLSTHSSLHGQWGLCFSHSVLAQGWYPAGHLPFAPLGASTQPQLPPPPPPPPLLGVLGVTGEGVGDGSYGEGVGALVGALVGASVGQASILHLRTSDAGHALPLCRASASTCTSRCWVPPPQDTVHTVH